MRTLLLALTATFFASAADANPDRVSVLIGSHHAGARQHFEEANFGAFLTWEGQRVDWSVGAYRNSYGKGSVAVMAAVPVFTSGKVEVALFGGLALYPENGRTFPIHVGDVVPLGGIQIRAGNLFVQAIPGDGKAADAIISFGLSFPLK